MRSKPFHSLLVMAALLAATGCSNPTPSEDQSMNSSAPSTSSQKNPGLVRRALAPKPVMVPAGTILTVRLGETISTKTAKAGDPFSGTIAEPVSVDGKVVIPDGSEASGTVSDSKGMGHFKGGALLSIVLNSVTIKGTPYTVQASANSHSVGGKGKRSTIMIGGGAGLGALIGGLAGGGKGAAIGAAAGAGAGAGGAAFTGNKDIVLPAESAVSFKLLQPIQVKM